MDSGFQIILIVAATVSVLACIIGLVLLVVRAVQSARLERQTAANMHEMSAAIREIETTMHTMCQRMAGNSQSLKDNQEDIRRMIAVVSQMVLDVERRLGADIKGNRDWFAMQVAKSGMAINFNQGAQGTQIGDGNHQS